MLLPLSDLPHRPSLWFLLHHSCTPSPCPCTRRVPSWALFVFLFFVCSVCRVDGTLARLGQRTSTSNDSLIRVPATPTNCCTVRAAVQARKQATGAGISTLAAEGTKDVGTGLLVALASVRQKVDASTGIIRLTDRRDLSVSCLSLPPLPPTSTVHLPTTRAAAGRDPAWTWT